MIKKRQRFYKYERFVGQDIEETKLTHLNYTNKIQSIFFSFFEMSEALYY